MAIEQDIALFVAKLDAAINETLLHEITDGAKDAIAEAVQTEVYDKYESAAKEPYERRGAYNGGLQDREAMLVTDFDSTSHSVTIEDKSMENDYTEDTYGRYVAPVVEGGVGYTWFFSGAYARQPFPRPFHKVAEERYASSGAFEADLASGLAARGFTVERD